MAQLLEQLIKYKLFPRPAYLPDLVPSDQKLFHNPGKRFVGKIFVSNEEV